MSSTSILQLSQAIANDAAILDEHFRSQGLPQPSFNEDGPSRLFFQDAEITAAQERLLSSTKELHHLALGPANSLRLALNSSLNAAALSVIHRLKIAQHVPLKDQVSIEALAPAVGIPASDLKTVLRLAMTDYVFHEPSPGMVAHTAASRLLLENPLISAWIDIGVEEMFPASAKVAEAMLQHPGSEEPTLSGWSLENNAELPLFEELSARHPRRANNFARAMEFMAAVTAPNVAARGLDWASLGRATMVDVGGGKGLACIEIARAFPDLMFIVQDLEETVAEGLAQLPEDLKGRVSFMTHDFFSPQPVKNADVYYLRAVFHNWPDKYCIKILQNLIPALKSGARILIQDPMFPEKGWLSSYQEQQAIASDLMMMAYFNSHNREAEEWPKLFAKADPRFSVQRVVKPGRQYPVERLATVEAIWNG